MTVSLANQLAVASQSRPGVLRTRANHSVLFGNQPQENKGDQVELTATPQAEGAAQPTVTTPKKKSNFRQTWAKMNYHLKRVFSSKAARPEVNLQELTNFDQLKSVFQTAERAKLELYKAQRLNNGSEEKQVALQQAADNQAKQQANFKAALKFYSRVNGESRSALVKQLQGSDEAKAIENEKLAFDTEQAYQQMADQFINIQVYPSLPEGTTDKRTIQAWEKRKFQHKFQFEGLFANYHRLSSQSKAAARARLAGDQNIAKRIAERREAVKDAYQSLLKSFVDLKTYEFTHAAELTADKGKVHNTKLSEYNQALNYYTHLSGEDKLVLKKRLELDRQKTNAFSQAEKEQQVVIDNAWGNVRKTFDAFAKSNSADDEAQLNKAMAEVKRLTGMEENDIINQLFQNDIDVFPGSED